MCEVIIAVYSLKLNHYLSVADKNGQERAENAEVPQNNHTPVADNHLAATVELFLKPDYDLLIPIIPESSSKKVVVEHYLYPPYMPFGCDGPRITMFNAIDILNR